MLLVEIWVLLHSPGQVNFIDDNIPVNAGVIDVVVVSIVDDNVIVDDVITVDAGV